MDTATIAAISAVASAIGVKLIEYLSKHTDTTAAEVSSLRKEWHELTKQVRECSDKLTAILEEKIQLSGKVDRLCAKVTTLSDALSAANAQLEKHNGRTDARSDS